jgi:hypothetical protein
MKTIIITLAIASSLALPILTAATANATNCTQTCSRGFGGSYTCNTWCY